MRLTDEQKQANRQARKAQKAWDQYQAKVNEEKNQRPVKKMTITIEWVKSRTWRANPRCTAQVEYATTAEGRGSFETSPVFTASGCGYCKESTVVAAVFNHYMKYKLWRLTAEQIKGGHGSMDNGPAPYGINCYKHTNEHGQEIEGRSFAGGIGTSCYHRIAEYIGGVFEYVAGGKTFDVYRYTDK